MKILIDENIDVEFKNEISEFDVKTVSDNKWMPETLTGVKNYHLILFQKQISSRGG